MRRQQDACGAGAAQRGVVRRNLGERLAQHHVVVGEHVRRVHRESVLQLLVLRRFTARRTGAHALLRKQLGAGGVHAATCS